MLTGPSLLGHLGTQKNKGRTNRNKRNLKLPGVAGMVNQTTTLPPHLYHKRKSLMAKVDPNLPHDPECKCFTYCDLLYQGFTPAERLKWRQALKKPGLSPYDLWMSECLTLTTKRQHPPDVPSISGGWSNKKCLEGSTRPLAPAWGPYLSNSVVRHASVQASNQGARPTWLVTVTCEPPPPDAPPSWGFFLVSQWRTFPYHFWWNHLTTHYTAPPIHWDRREHYTDKFLIQWPGLVPHLVSAPFHEPAPWDHQAPNYLPWPPPPAPLQPWPMKFF